VNTYQTDICLTEKDTDCNKYLKHTAMQNKHNKLAETKHMNVQNYTSQIDCPNSIYKQEKDDIYNEKNHRYMHYL